MIDTDTQGRPREVPPRPPQDLLIALRRRSRPLDLLALLAVPLALVAVFFLPPSVKAELALTYRQPTVMAMFASHFVHFGAGHLLANLAGYGLLAPFAYVFCVLSGRRAHFYVAFVTILLAFPFALSALNVAFSRPAVGFGFSGLVMAFLGFLPLALLWFVEAQFGAGVDVEHAPLFFFLGAALIATWAVPATASTMAVAGVALLAGAYYLWRLAAAVDASPPMRRWASRVGYAEVALAGVLLYFAFPFAAFPQLPAGDGAVLNLYSHVLGYAFGFIVPYVTFGDVVPGSSLSDAADPRAPELR